MVSDLIVPADLFVPAKGIYLLNHSVGRMPASTRDHVEQGFFSAWEQGEPDAWSRWMPVFDDFRQALAALFNGEEKDFCPQVNISSALTKVLYSLPARPGKNVIVLTENDFPSVGFVVQLAQKQGYEIRWVPSSADELSLETWASVLQDDVLAVLISHVHFNTSTRVPVKDVVALAREHDIVSMVDIAQSSGVVPIDLQDWQADVVMGSCVKWLCGGPGAGFLWVSPDIVDQLQPVDGGWFSHRNPFEFDIRNFEYADSAARFWGGTPSVLPFTVAANSIRLLTDIGIETVAAHNRQLTRRLIDAAEPGCVQTPLEDCQRGGTLVLKPRNQEQVVSRLQQANVRFDCRALGIRLSPHIYNTDAEIDRVIECLSY